MKINELEKTFDIESRNLTGVGFLTNFIVNEELKTISFKKSFVSDESVLVLETFSELKDFV